MPFAPLYRCSFTGCTRRQPGRRWCAEHAGKSPRNHHGIPPERRGYGAEYDRLVPIVIARDGGLCQLKLRNCTIEATTADHIVAISHGGLTVIDNLRGSCVHCNRARGNRPILTIEAGEGVSARRSTPAGSSVAQVSRVSDVDHHRFFGPDGEVL